MKRTFVFLVTGLVVLSLALAGCGAKTDESAVSSDEPAAQPTPTTTTPTTPAPSTTPKAGGAPVTIGIVTSLTGQLAVGGKQVEVGIREAAQEWQVKTGQEVKILVEDDTSTVDGVKAAFDKLIQQKPAAIYLPNNSPAVDALGKAVPNPGVPVFFCNGSDSLMTGSGYYKICTAAEEWTYLSAQYAIKELGAKKPAAIHINQSFVPQYDAHFKKLGATPVFNEIIKTDQDITAAVTKIKEAGADLIFTTAVMPYSAKIALAVKSLGLNIPVMGTGGSCTPDYGKLAGSAKEGVTCTAFATTGIDDGSKPFVTTMQKNFPGVDVSAYTAIYFDGANLLLNAAQKAGTSTDTAKVQASLLEIQNFKGVAGTYSFDSKGFTRHEYNILRWQGENMTAIKTMTYTK